MNEVLKDLLYLKDPLGVEDSITLTVTELEELCEKIEDDFVCVEEHCDDNCNACNCYDD